jgi:flagellar hook-basal body protein
MTLYGALFTGVSGLNAQGQKIAIISDNIANVNTVGYKEGEAQFETLVVNSTLQSAYSPGGVRNNTRVNIDKQGILTSTSSPTDIAISGNGFFAVKSTNSENSQVLYSRAGSFRQDSLGNFVNSQGFYLQGWPLDRDGRLPGEPGNTNSVSFANLDSLKTVNVESASGVAQATSVVDVGINLNSGEDVYPGASATITMDILSPNNYGISQTDIIVPDETSATAPSFGLATTNNLSRGDKFTVSTGSGLSYDYEYGGFTIGRQVTSSNLATNTGDRNTNLSSTDIFGAVGATAITVNNTDTFYTVDVGAAHGLAVGDKVRLSNVVLTGATGIPLSEFNGVVTVASTPTANTFTVTTSVAAATGGPVVNVTSALYNTRIFSGNILDATSATQSLISSATGTTGYTEGALSFTISSPDIIPSGTATFTYKVSSLDAKKGEFNSLTNLAEAISQTDGLNARVSNGRLVVGAENASSAVTFANVDATGAGALQGIDWIQELDLRNVASGTRRFSTMEGLSKIAIADEGVTAKVLNGASEASLVINVDNPLDTVRIQDYVGTSTALGANPVTAIAIPGAGGAGTADITITQAAHSFAVGNNVLLGGLAAMGTITAAELNTTHPVTAVVPGVSYTVTVNTAAVVVPATPAGGAAGTVQGTNIGSLLGELGLVDSLNGGAYVRGDTGNLGPIYDAAGVTGKNMASGDIDSPYSRSFRVYDSLGAGHDLSIAFVKTATNTWAVEVFALNPEEINTSLPNGQIASGTVEFNGDASLKSVSSALTRALSISWTNGASSSEITLGLGTAGVPSDTVGATVVGDTKGLSQFKAGFNTAFINQNGAPVGDLVGITIDKEGYVVAGFSNGENQKIYKIPLADFSNPNGLKPISGNVFSQTTESGEVNLRESGSSGVGNIVSNTVEASNVDLAQQLTDMIVAQRAYQSNTRVISTADDLLDRLNQI